MKVLGIAAAAVVAFAPLSVAVIAPGVAQAAPCAGAGSTPAACQRCQYWVVRYHLPTARSCFEAAPPRPAQPAPSSVPAQVPELPPLPPVPSEPPTQIPTLVPPSPPPPSTISVGGTPVISPLSPGAPRDFPLVATPKGLDAPPQTVAAAKAAPATRVDPADPPKPPTQVDFNRQVQSVVDSHGDHVDIVRADNQSLVRPRHWDYIDYDEYHRPTLYNPLNQTMTFRYFYNGAFEEAYVPAGARIVLDAADIGLYPFTAVGYSYVASGSFHGGAWIPPKGWTGPPPPNYVPPAPPRVYHDVSAYVPAGNRTVAIGQVEVVSHDGKEPPGIQDTFLLNDSTLAWGQVNDPGSNTQITVTKTQPLPGVGKTDNGSYLVELASHQEASSPAPSWWPMALRFGGFAVVVGLIAWLLNRRKRSEELTASR